MTASDLVYAPIRENFIFKADYGQDLQTFVNCKFNKAYNSDDYEDTDFNSTHILAYRNCTKCPPATPFSYGYQDKEC